MGILKILDQEFSVDCLIFDKDGTLIDMDTFWGPQTQQWVERMASAQKLGGDFKQELYDLLGYSEDTNHVRSESPMAVATMEAIYSLAAGVLSRYGMPWHEARHLAESCAAATFSIDLTPQDILPMGNLVGLMQSLRDVGIQIAVVTSDDRQITQNMLDHLGIRDLVSILICGDDRLPPKPAPDVIWRIANQLDIPPSRMMVVGDSLSDMQFAANAGAAYRIGVMSKAEANSRLAEYTDAVIASLDEIKVIPQDND